MQLEESVPVRLYRGLMLLIETRQCKIDAPADLTQEKFLHAFGRGSVQIATTRIATKDRFLILVLAGHKTDFVDKLLGTMDDKMRSDPKTRDYAIDILIVHDVAKYAKHPAFVSYGVTETVKTYGNIICNPIQHMCASPARIITEEELHKNALAAGSISTKHVTDPVAYWLWAKPGDIIMELEPHENTGYVPTFSRVGAR